MKSKIYLLPLCLLFILSACQNKSQSGDAINLDYEKYTLDNGLEVVLHQDFSDPIVAVAIQYHVGSSREKPGKTGFAHFFEHMLFQRSEHLKRNAFFTRIGELGGEFNGSTGNDGTNYFEVVPRNALEKVLWMESDRMGFFINTVTLDGLKREIDVVSNEKRQGENRAFGLSSEIMDRNFFPQGHPYSWPVIGSIKDLNSASIEDVKDFYHTYYLPNNATLVVSGDFELEKAKELIQKYFGEIKAGPQPILEIPEPVVVPQTKRLVYEDRFARQSELDLAYPGVRQYTEDAYPLQLLGQILANGQDAPLYRSIVKEKQLASQVFFRSGTMEQAGQISFSAQVFADIPLDSVYAAYNDALADFEAEGVNPDDLERHKNSYIMNSYNLISGLLYKTLTIARSNEFAGRPDQIKMDVERVQAVTAEDIMRVYKKYVKGQNHVILSTVPVGSSALALSGSSPVSIEEEQIEDQIQNAKEGKIVDDDYEFTPSEIDRTKEPDFLPNTPEVKLPEIWTAELPGGMKAKGLPYSEVPLVNFSISFNRGALNDPVGKNGTASLTARLLNQGTADKTPAELQQAIGRLGARLQFLAGSETSYISGSCISRNFPQLMELVQEMLVSPRWDEAELEIIKKRSLDNIHRSKTEPRSIATEAYNKLFYGNDSPLSQPAGGTEESIQSITMDDLKTFFAENYSINNATFDYVGPMTAEEITSVLTPFCNAWNVQGKTVEDIQPGVMVSQKAKVYFIDLPGAKQSYIILGGPCMQRNSSDYFPAMVANQLLGASSSGKFFEVLRLQKGYTYGAYSQFNASSVRNSFIANSSVQAIFTKESLDTFRELVTSYPQSFDSALLERTIETLRLEKTKAYETPLDRLAVLQNITEYNLPLDYVQQEFARLNNITLSEIQDVMAKYLNYDNMFFVVVGDAKTQAAKLKKSNIGKVEIIEQ